MIVFAYPSFLVFTTVKKLVILFIHPVGVESIKNHSSPFRKATRVVFLFLSIFVLKLTVFIHLDPFLVPVNPPTPTGRNKSRCQQHVASQTRLGWFCI